MSTNDYENYIAHKDMITLPQAIVYIRERQVKIGQTTIYRWIQHGRYGTKLRVWTDDIGQMWTRREWVDDFLANAF